jgi:hypothetical protein
MKMRTILSFTVLFAALSAGQAFALPVLNANTPGAVNVTVFPDHADATLFYLAPTVFVIAKREDGVPNFSYMEYKTNGYRRAIVQTTLRPDFSYDEIEKAKAAILANVPAARFTSLPFEDSKVNFIGSLAPLLVDSDCQHPAGTVADEQTCAFHLRNSGVKVMRPMFKTGLTITTQFVYTINGVRQNADGTYSNHANSYQVAGRLGGPELAAHPELFIDSNGKTIKSSLSFLGEMLEGGSEDEETSEGGIETFTPGKLFPDFQTRGGSDTSPPQEH